MYDITNHQSLQEAKWWLKQLKKTCDVSSMTIGFVGNKLDLADEARQVGPDEVRDFVEEHDLVHCETSAKTAANVSELFTRICERVTPLPARIARPPLNRGRSARASSAHASHGA